MPTLPTDVYNLLMTIVMLLFVVAFITLLSGLWMHQQKLSDPEQIEMYMNRIQTSSDQDVVEPILPSNVIPYSVLEKRRKQKRNGIRKQANLNW